MRRIFCFWQGRAKKGAVIVPGYGIERDSEFVSFVEQAFPDRTVVQVDVTGNSWRWRHSLHHAAATRVNWRLGNL